MIQRRVPVSLKTEEARATLEVLRRAATHATVLSSSQYAHTPETALCYATNVA